MISSRSWRTPPTGEAWSGVRAAVLPLVTCAILAGFRDDVTSATSALILVLWVVAAAASGDRVAGVVAALSGGIWFDFFLTEPYQRFTISRPGRRRGDRAAGRDRRGRQRDRAVGAPPAISRCRSLRLPRRCAERSEAGVRGRHPAVGLDRRRRSPDHRRARSRSLPLRAGSGPRHTLRPPRPRRRGHSRRARGQRRPKRSPLRRGGRDRRTTRARHPGRLRGDLRLPHRPTPPRNSVASRCYWQTRSPQCSPRTDVGGAENTCGSAHNTQHICQDQPIRFAALPGRNAARALHRRRRSTPSRLPTSSRIRAMAGVSVEMLSPAKLKRESAKSSVVGASVTPGATPG